MSEMRIWTILQWNIKQNKNIVLPFFSVQTTFRNPKKREDGKPLVSTAFNPRDLEQPILWLCRTNDYLI